MIAHSFDAHSRQGVLLVVNMLQNCSYLPPPLASALPDQFATLVAELEAGLREAIASEEAHLDARKYVLSYSAALQELTVCVLFVAVFCIRLACDLCSILIPWFVVPDF